MYSDDDIRTGFFDVNLDPPFLVLYGKEEAALIDIRPLDLDSDSDSDDGLKFMSIEVDAPRLRFYRTLRFFDTLRGFYSV